MTDSEGDLPSDTNPADLTRFVATLSHGMAAQAAGRCNSRWTKTGRGDRVTGLADVNQALNRIDRVWTVDRFAASPDD